MPRLAAAIALLLLAAGCGSTRVVQEPPVVVSGGDRPAAAPGTARDTVSDVRIAVVTHGQASSPFWAIVRTGVQAAARQMNARVDYEAPDVYSLPKMIDLIDAAVAARPDGLVVSIPEPGLAPAIRRAVRAGIPVVSINSGNDVYRRLGVLAHVGQPEGRAGLAAGRRLARAGVRRALCVNQQVGNQGLDARCAGLARAMAAGRIDGILATNATGAMEAVRGTARLRGARRPRIAAFDLAPEVLEAVRAGRLLFAVDQQPYLQGYMPVVMLVNRARYGIFPSQGDVVATGANFVTRANAAQAIALSERSIR